jgi:hypothetical protein
MYDAGHVSLLQGVKEFLGRINVQNGLSVYWDYFNPSYLFFSGGSNLSTATRRVGVFLLPLSVFLACGVYELWRRSSGPMRTVLAAGLAIAPLPATFVGERYAIQRELALLPFAALIATIGASCLLRHSARTVRAGAVVLLLAMPIQFAVFYRDYFSDYRIRSAFAFDPTNFRDVATYLIATGGSGQTPIYLSGAMDDVAARWRFYLVKYRREDMLQRTSLFTATRLELERVPSGSLLVLYANDPAVPELLRSAQCAVAAFVTDIAGNRSAVILRKTG